MKLTWLFESAVVFSNSWLFAARDRLKTAVDIPERKSTGATADLCKLPEPFSLSKTSNEFSIAKYVASFLI